MDAITKLARAEADASWIEVRLDARRDTRMSVTHTREARHIHVTLGSHGKAVLILHPHAAKRLIANIQAVLDGAGFSHG